MRRRSVYPTMLKILPVLLVVASCRASVTLKPIHRAPRAVSNEGVYFVHLREDATEEETDVLIRDLERRHSDPSDSSFEANVEHTLTVAMNGFVGRLSEKAVTFVSDSNLYCNIQMHL